MYDVMTKQHDKKDGDANVRLKAAFAHGKLAAPTYAQTVWADAGPPCSSPAGIV